MSYLITGYLTKDSPMRAVFPTGIIPLARTGPLKVMLGDSSAPEDCYFLAIKSCTREELERAAEMMAGLGQGSKEQAQLYLSREHLLPIRAMNISIVSLSHRAFL